MRLWWTFRGPETAAWFALLALAMGCSPKPDCTRKASGDHDWLVCGRAVGGATVVDKAIMKPEGLEASAMAGLTTGFGKARATERGGLRRGLSILPANRYDFDARDGGTRTVWTVVREQGQDYRLDFCIIPPGTRSSRADCEGMLPLLEDLRPARIEPQMSASHAIPSIRGRKLDLPPDCDLTPASAIECEHATLAVSEEKEPTVPLDTLVEAYEKNFRSKGAVSKTRVACAVDSVPMSCWDLRFSTSDGHVMQILLGEISSNPNVRVEAHCTMTDVDLKEGLPVPCGQVFKLL